MIKEAIRYLGIGYMDLADPLDEVYQRLDKANLYYRWGQQKGEKDDYIQAYDAYLSILNDNLDGESILSKYDNLLTIYLEVLKLELKEVVENFEFLCSHRLRIELRGIDFAVELNRNISKFLDREEFMQESADELKKELTDVPLNDSQKEQRKELLEIFDQQKEQVNSGVEAFYNRVRDYVSESQ